MNFEPYIYKQNGRYFLAVGKNIYATPCHCHQITVVHFHHNTGIKNASITYKVEDGKEYPES